MSCCRSKWNRFQKTQNRYHNFVIEFFLLIENEISWAWMFGVWILIVCTCSKHPTLPQLRRCFIYFSLCNLVTIHKHIIEFSCDDHFSEPNNSFGASFRMDVMFRMESFNSIFNFFGFFAYFLETLEFFRFF